MMKRLRLDPNKIKIMIGVYIAAGVITAGTEVVKALRKWADPEGKSKTLDKEKKN